MRKQGIVVGDAPLSASRLGTIQDTTDAWRYCREVLPFSRAFIKDLILRYGARRVADPMEGSGTSRDVISGLNRYKRLGISYWAGDLRTGFDLTKQDLD